MKTEVYLGDGAYARDNGMDITVYCERDSGTHYVVLEPQVLGALFDFVAKMRNLEIKIIRKGETNVQENP